MPNSYHLQTPAAIPIMVDMVALSYEYLLGGGSLGDKAVDGFDAYYQWLGIAPEEQPPDHYRLLGLKPFEDSPTVISHAADRQMAHVRTFQTGPHTAASQKLLNEIAAARVCLLSAEKKEVYDLRLRQASAKTPSADAPGRPHAAVDPELAKLLGHVEADPSATRSRAAIARHKGRRRLALVILSLILLAVVGVLSWVFLFSAHAPPKQASSSDPVQRSEPRTDDGALASPEGDSVGGTPPAVPDDDHPTKDKEAGPEGVVPWEDYPMIPEDRRPSEPDTSPSEADVPSGSAVDRPGETDTVEPDAWQAVAATTQSSPPRPKVETKHPVPAPDAARRITEALDEVYAFSKTRTLEQSRDLVGELFSRGQKRGAAADEQFVVLHKAMEIAGRIGETKAMLRMAEMIGRRYQVDPWSLKRDMLKQMATEITDGAAAHSFLLSLEGVLNGALEDERYDVAEELAKAGYRASMHVASPTLRTKWKESHQAIPRLCQRAQKVQEAQKRLETASDDPKANLLAGRWYCFERNDWKRGLPHLAKGSDASLGKLAKQELRPPPEDPSDQVRLADGWWELARSAKKSEREVMRRHAADWYRRAEPKLGDEVKLRVTKRLASLAQSANGKGGRRNGVAATTPRAEEAAPNRPTAATTRRAVPCRVAALCDGQFEMYVNGQLFMKGGLNEVSSRVGTFAKGDIITVRAVSTGGPRGFACAILSQKGGLVVTGQAWRSYQPKSSDEWYRQSQIGPVTPVVVGDGNVAKRLFEKTRVRAASIWGRKNTCYLVLQIP